MFANAAPTPRAPSSSLHGRRPQPPPAVALPALDLHAWADGWSLSTAATTTSRVPSALDDAVSPTSLAPQAPAGRGFGAAGTRAGSVAPRLGGAPSPSSSSSPSYGQHAASPTKPASALEGFALDGDRAPAFSRREGQRDEVYQRMRQNSLELSLGDLPKPAPFLRAAADAHPYPSPVSPSSRLFFVDKAPSCYFDPAHTAAAAASTPGPASTISRDDVALPASPALVPLAFGQPEPSSATLSAPRVEPSSTHPLHRAKRLSMTPLSSTKALPPVDEAPTADLADMVIDEPPKLRKSSIVDLPLPQAAGGNGLPFTPPLTPPTVSAALGPARTSKRQRRP